MTFLSAIPWFTGTLYKNDQCFWHLRTSELLVVIHGFCRNPLLYLKVHILKLTPRSLSHNICWAICSKIHNCNSIVICSHQSIMNCNGKNKIYLCSIYIFYRRTNYLKNELNSVRIKHSNPFKQSNEIVLKATKYWNNTVPIILAFSRARFWTKLNLHLKAKKKAKN